VLSIEQGLDGSMAVAFQGRYLRYRMCPAAERPATVPTSPAAPPPHQPAAQPRRRTRWMEGFDLQNAPPLWKAVESSGSRAES
jgi:hypothetical protein